VQVYYFDTSALAKRYVGERGTDWVRNVAETDVNSEIHIVRIIGPEIVSAFYRKVRLNEMSPEEAQRVTHLFSDDVRNQYQVIEVTEELVNIAMSLAQRHVLRGYDSVHLAAALETYTSLANTSMALFTFVSADVGLNRAAQSEGLSVANPTKALNQQNNKK
jgi:hypothetical protein